MRASDGQLRARQQCDSDRSSGSDSDECPSDFVCPLSLARFRDPVMLVQSGMTYERVDLLVALARRPGIDPQTNEPFEGAPLLKENVVLRRLMNTLQPVRRGVLVAFPTISLTVSSCACVTLREAQRCWAQNYRALTFPL